MNCETNVEESKRHPSEVDGDGALPANVEQDFGLEQSDEKPFDVSKQNIVNGVLKEGSDPNHEIRAPTADQVACGHHWTSGSCKPCTVEEFGPCYDIITRCDCELITPKRIEMFDLLPRGIFHLEKDVEGLVHVSNLPVQYREVIQRDLESYSCENEDSKYAAQGFDHTMDFYVEGRNIHLLRNLFLRHRIVSEFIPQTSEVPLKEYKESMADKRTKMLDLNDMIYGLDMVNIEGVSLFEVGSSAWDRMKSVSTSARAKVSSAYASVTQLFSPDQIGGKIVTAVTAETFPGIKTVASLIGGSIFALFSSWYLLRLLVTPMYYMGLDVAANCVNPINWAYYFYSRPNDFITFGVFGAIYGLINQQSFLGRMTVGAKNLFMDHVYSPLSNFFDASKRIRQVVLCGVVTLLAAFFLYWRRSNKKKSDEALAESVKELAAASDENATEKMQTVALAKVFNATDQAGFMTTLTDALLVVLGLISFTGMVKPQVVLGLASCGRTYSDLAKRLSKLTDTQRRNFVILFLVVSVMVLFYITGWHKKLYKMLRASVGVVDEQNPVSEEKDTEDVEEKDEPEEKEQKQAKTKKKNKFKKLYDHGASATMANDDRDNVFPEYVGKQRMDPGLIERGERFRVPEWGAESEDEQVKKVKLTQLERNQSCINAALDNSLVDAPWQLYENKVYCVDSDNAQLITKLEPVYVDKMSKYLFNKVKVQLKNFLDFVTPNFTLESKFCATPELKLSLEEDQERKQSAAMDLLDLTKISYGVYGYDGTKRYFLFNCTVAKDKIFVNHHVIPTIDTVLAAGHTMRVGISGGQPVEFDSLNFKRIGDHDLMVAVLPDKLNSLRNKLELSKTEAVQGAVGLHVSVQQPVESDPATRLLVNPVVFGVGTNDRIIRYRSKTSPGTSGSAVLSRVGNAKGYLCGIHMSGIQGEDENSATSVNVSSALFKQALGNALRAAVDYAIPPSSGERLSSA